VRIEYAKAATDAAAFEVLDMAGRVVDRIAAPDNATAEGTVTWDGRIAAGTRAPAGVYFVRMRVGGRPIDTRKVALIE
jgi:flagellar hook assembly protein FlgD